MNTVIIDHGLLWISSYMPSYPHTWYPMKNYNQWLFNWQLSNYIISFTFARLLPKRSMHFPQRRGVQPKIHNRIYVHFGLYLTLKSVCHVILFTLKIAVWGPFTLNPPKTREKHMKNKSKISQRILLITGEEKREKKKKNFNRHNYEIELLSNSVTSAGQLDRASFSEYPREEIPGLKRSAEH